MTKEIIYIWIKNYKGVLINTEINFGSEFVFSMEQKEDKLHLCVNKNGSYIDDFFQIEKGNGIQNVTALIGENGTGKSLIVELIRKIITGDGFIGDFIFISRNQIDGKEVFKVRKELDNELTISSKVEFNHEVVGPNRGWKPGKFRVPIGGGYHGIPDTEVVYYSPIVDFSNTDILRNTPKGIDISSNNLIYEELSKNEFSREGDLKPEHFITIPRANNYIRHFNMIYGLTTIEFPDGGVHFDKDNIVIRLIKLKINLGEIFDSENGWNVPISHKSILKEIYSLYKNQRSTIHAKQTKIDREEKDAGVKFHSLEQELFYNEFLIESVKFFVYNLNQSNTHLQKDSKLHSLDIKGKNLIQLINLYFNSQTIFSATSLLGLIEIMGEYRKRIRFADADSEDIPVINIEQDSFISIYSNYLAVVEEFTIKSVGGIFKKPNDFLEFDSGINSSSGEKAYLDLYSRLYFATKILEEEVQSPMSSRDQWPEHIVILIDEGELGFHPQWQREYLHSLLKNIPIIFRRVGEKTGKGTFNIEHSNIQLIITSHSPMFLSDMPVSNVNFLKKEKDESGLISTNLYYGSDSGISQTFGANIHDLLKDKFFLNKGFIGEFAKKWISDFIIFLNFKEDQKEDHSNIAPELNWNRQKSKDFISIIGEPILKMKLAEMYDSKFKEDFEIELLKKRIKDIEEGKSME